MNKFLNNGINAFKKSNYKSYIIYASVIVFIYFPLVSQYFAMTDDYAMLDIAIGHSGNLLEWDVVNGRPIYGIFQYLVQSHMINVPRLSLLRLFSILSTVILCCFIFKFIFVKIKVSSQNFVSYLPMFIVFIPSIVVYNSWATCFVFVFSIFLSGLAYYLLFDINRVTTIGRFICSVFVLICSFFVYQATAMVFLYFVFLSNCIDSRKIKFVNLIISALVIAISMFAALLSVKILPKLLYGYVIERSDLNTDIMAKIHWFFHGPLKIAINNYNLTPNILYTCVSIILVAVGFFCTYKESQGKIKIVLVIILMIGTMIPALLAKESWTSARSSVGLYLIIITIIIYGLIKVSEKYLSKYNTKMLLFFLLFVIGIYTQYYIYGSVIRQQQSEYQALTQEMGRVVPKDYSGLIRFDLSNPIEGAFAKVSFSDEIGHTSIQTPWALKGIAQSIKKLKGLNFQIDNSDLLLKPKEECKDNCIIIHCSNILRDAINYK